MMKRMNESKVGSDDSPMKKGSSKQSDGKDTRKPRSVRVWGQIPSYYQPEVEHYVTHKRNSYKIDYFVDGEDVLAERKLAKPNRRRIKREV